MNTRLETIAKDLAEKLEMSDSGIQRKASIAACELALQAASLEAPIISESLEQLRQNKQLTQKRIAELSDLSAQLDERYFNTQNNAALQTKALRFFSQARAVSALSFAGGEDALVAAMESIYEASMVFDDNSNFFAVVKGALPDFRQ
jgi:hypothetical protein